MTNKGPRIPVDRLQQEIESATALLQVVVNEPHLDLTDARDALKGADNAVHDAAVAKNQNALSDALQEVIRHALRCALASAITHRPKPSITQEGRFLLSSAEDEARRLNAQDPDNWERHAKSHVRQIRAGLRKGQPVDTEACDLAAVAMVWAAQEVGAP